MCWGVSVLVDVLVVVLVWGGAGVVVVMLRPWEPRRCGVGGAHGR